MSTLQHSNFNYLTLWTVVTGRTLTTVPTYSLHAGTTVVAGIRGTVAVSEVVEVGVRVGIISSVRNEWA